MQAAAAWVTQGSAQGSDGNAVHVHRLGSWFWVLGPGLGLGLGEDEEEEEETKSLRRRSFLDRENCHVETTYIIHMRRRAGKSKHEGPDSYHQAGNSVALLP